MALVEAVGLSPHAPRQAGTYSGGNRRKLALAIALVGRPAVVLLDEPSSGMDASSKRLMWSAIQTQTRATGASAVLVSHSMEECEALCGRVGIMVDGRLVCLGTAHRLKARFGGGYSVTLRARSATGLAAIVRRVEDWARGAAGEGLAGCLVEEARGELVVVRLPISTASESTAQPPRLSEVFDALEKEREDLGIASYVVTQSSLERVFLRLAGSDADTVA